MKLKRLDILNLDYILKTATFDQPICGRFRYMLTSNLKKTESEINQINEAFPVPESYTAYQKAMGEVYKEFNVTSLDQINDLEEEKKTELESKLDALNDEHTEAIEEFNAIEEEKNEFLQEEVDIDLKPVKASDVPNISDDNQHNHWEIWSILSKIVIDD